jgi:hypothetical protein
MALKYRKNVILVYQTDERHGGVAGPFFDFYGAELKRTFPNPDDYKWLTRNSYVQLYDRGQHVDVMLHDAHCTNGILDQMAVPCDQRGGHDAGMAGDIPKQMPRAQVAPSDPLLPPQPLQTSACAPSATPVVSAVTPDPQTRKHSLPRDTLEELLDEAGLRQHYEVICAKGYASAIDLAEAASEELDELVQVLQLRPPETRRLRKSIANLTGRQQ